MRKRCRRAIYAAYGGRGVTVSRCTRREGHPDSCRFILKKAPAAGHAVSGPSIQS